MRAWSSARNADAGVAYRDGNRIGLRIRLDDDRDAAAIGKLDGVAGEVEQHLAQPRRVADDAHRQPLVDVAADFQPFRLGARPEQLDRLLDEGCEDERPGREIDPPGLDLGEIEDLLDQRQQRLPDVRTALRYAVCSGVSGVSPMRSAMPRMPFSGVRISCDTMARKRDLARLAVSA